MFIHWNQKVDWFLKIQLILPFFGFLGSNTTKIDSDGEPMNSVLDHAVWSNGGGPVQLVQQVQYIGVLSIDLINLTDQTFKFEERR